MTRSNSTRMGAKRVLLYLAAAVAMVSWAALAWGGPERPKRIFYGTDSDDRLVLVKGKFHPPGSVVQIYYRCSSTAGAQAVLDVTGHPPLRSLRCDDKVHWMRNHRVTPGKEYQVSLGMYSGGKAALSIWAGP
jgi:hypothetical protein